MINYLFNVTDCFQKDNLKHSPHNQKFKHQVKFTKILNPVIKNEIYLHETILLVVEIRFCSIVLVFKTATILYCICQECKQLSSQNYLLVIMTYTPPDIKTNRYLNSITFVLDKLKILLIFL